MTTKITKIEKSNLKNQNCGVLDSSFVRYSLIVCAARSVKRKTSCVTSCATATIKRICFLFSIFFFLSLSGCNSTNEKTQLLEKVEQLTEENSKLTSRIKQSESQNKQLQKQVQVLSDLPADVKGENVYTVRQIKIGRFSGFYNKNETDEKEILIVYVQPIDDEGDAIKASGTMDVELWDLNQPENKALLGHWKVGPQELKHLWSATMLTINYRLTFNISDIVKDFDKPYTVKVKFTDYLSGRVFEDQRVIKQTSAYSL